MDRSGIDYIKNGILSAGCVSLAALLICCFGCTPPDSGRQDGNSSSQDGGAGGEDERVRYEFIYEGNPLVRHISATDPDAHVWDDTLWVYCSQDHQRKPGSDDYYEVMDGYHVYSTADMVNWTDHGEILHSSDVKWGRDGYMWAPGAARRNGKYYLYFPHRDRQDKWHIGIATSLRPDGPFKDIGRPLIGLDGIDPMVFVDDDGEAYIYCNPGGDMARLKPDMIDLAETPRRPVYGPDEVMKEDTLRFLEGAYMHKYNGKYYFSYTNWQNPKRQGFYAVGDSPYGPFEWKGAMAYAPEGGGQDHHSIVEFKGKWYYFYHYGGEPFKPFGWNGSRRILCFDELEYNEDGTIRMVKQTRQVVTPGMQY